MAEKTAKITAELPQETVEEVTSNNDGRKEGWTWATCKRGSKKICEGAHPTKPRTPQKCLRTHKRLELHRRGRS